MKRSKLLAVVLVSLVLSEHARSADAESTKGPLTAAEKVQCEAQRTEFNKSVASHNAKVDEIQALGAEIETLRAELDKEEAAVDRRDSTAMQALNVKIGKNNDLVQRHEQMGLSLVAVANENKQHIAQIREACLTRPVALSPAQKTQPSVSDCNSTAGAKGVERQIETTFAEMRVDEKQRQAEVERVAQARAKAQSWSDEKRSKIWMQILISPKFMAFEREKRPYVQELMGVLGSKPKNGQEQCKIVQRIAAMLPRIKAVNARQYAFMADQIRVAK